MNVPGLLKSLIIGIILGIGLGLYFVLLLASQDSNESIGYYLTVFIPAVVFMALSVPLVMAAVSTGRELSRKQRAVGVILGAGLGLLFDSTLALLLRTPLIYLIVFSIGLVIVLPIVAGIILGIRIVKRRAPPELPWPVLLLLAVALWPAAIALPFEARALQLRLSTPAKIPVYPNAQRIHVMANLGDNEETSDSVTLVFLTTAESSDVVSFYKDELSRRGWREGPKSFIEREIGGTPYWFENNRQHIHIRFLGAAREGEMFIVIYEPGDLFFGVDMLALKIFGGMVLLFAAWLLWPVVNRNLFARQTPGK